MDPEHAGYQDVTITAATATREGPPGMITLRYSLSAVPQGWRDNFPEAYSVAFRTPTAFKDVDRNQIVMTMREAEATEHNLAAVRQTLDQAVDATNHKTKADLTRLARGEPLQEEQAPSAEERLSKIQAILDKQ